MSLLQEQKRPYAVFYSYADEDESLLKNLDKFLTTLKREGEIEGWSKCNIGAGKEWKQEIKKNMNKSSIILLLISSHFIASDYNYNHELDHAMQRSKDKQAIIIPIILRPCDWESLPFSYFEVLPQNMRPVTKWSNRDEAFDNITRSIRRAVQNLREYEEEVRTNRIDPEPKSIYTDQLPYQSYKPLKINQTKPKQQDATKMAQATSKTATKRSTSKRQTTSAQIARTSSTSATWRRKSLKKSWLDAYISIDELNKRSKGKMGIVTLLILLLDVLCLAVLSQGWTKYQQLPILVFVISLLMFTWGILNIKPYIAFLLTGVYCIVWLLVGFYYLHWKPLPILVLIATFSIVHFILFRKYEKIKLGIR